MTSTSQAVEQFVSDEYQHGFVTPIESDTLPPGLGEEVIRAISARKHEPAWMLQRRFQAYHHWLTMTRPDWAHLQHTPIDFHGISYYSAPKSQADGPHSLEDVDPELLETYSKLGIPLDENTKKSKDFGAALVVLEQQFGGAAATAIAGLAARLDRGRTRNPR